MNQFVHDWASSMGDAFAPLGVEDDGLMELLWCNGHVVMQSQAPRKPPRSDKEAAVQGNEAEAWFQCPIEDPLERDLFSELFSETPADVPSRAACKEEEDCAAVTAPQLSRPNKACLEEIASVSNCAVGKPDAGGDGAAATETGESSMLTIGSSFCGSNHVQTTPRVVPPTPPRGEKAGARARDKRKQRDVAETEDVEFESAVVTCEPAQKLKTAKRRRAAEVHNLSERRRRDRINEKMKALQELIPHCNKTDKASMLDEAIEYLRSLQLQLQVMWMGGGMATAAPVMFPAGVHQYMQRMVGPPHVAAMPRLPPFMAPPAVQSPPVGQMPVADPYAGCLAVDSLQTPGPMHYLQGVNFYQQQRPAPPPPPVVPGGSLPAATALTLPSDNTLHKEHESSSKPETKGVDS